MHVFLFSEYIIISHFVDFKHTNTHIHIYTLTHTQTHRLTHTHILIHKHTLILIHTHTKLHWVFFFLLTPSTYLISLILFPLFSSTIPVNISPPVQNMCPACTLSQEIWICNFFDLNGNASIFYVDACFSILRCQDNCCSLEIYFMTEK